MTEDTRGMRLRFYSEESCCLESSSIVKTEGSGIIIEEMNKAIDDDVVQSSSWVMPWTLHNNMFTGLEFSLSAWAAEAGVGEETLLVLANGGMFCGHAGELGAQYIGEAYNREPRPSLGVHGPDDALFFVFKVQEKLAFFMAGGK